MPSTSRGYPYPVPADPSNGPAQIQAAVAAVDSDVAACVPDLALTSLGDIGPFVAGAYTTSVLTAAGDALVAVIRPKVTVTPTKFAWWCSVQSGNYDLAIINATTRARLWSLGATACPAAGAIVNNIVAGPTLTAGVRYGLVFAADNITLAIRSCPINGAGMETLYDGTIGYGRSTVSYPVPATLAAWGAATNVPALALRA